MPARPRTMADELSDIWRRLRDLATAVARATAQNQIGGLVDVAGSIVAAAGGAITIGHRGRLRIIDEDGVEIAVLHPSGHAQLLSLEVAGSLTYRGRELAGLLDGTEALPPVTETTWPAVWSGTWDEQGDRIVDFAGDAVQGNAAPGGQHRGLIGFDPAAVQAALAGREVAAAAVDLTAVEWLTPGAGVAVLGTHDYTALPAVWAADRVVPDRARLDWPATGTRTVDLGVLVGRKLRDGAATGVAIGPAPDTAAAWYGRFAGAAAVLRVSHYP